MHEPDFLSGQHFRSLMELETGKAKQQLQFDVPDEISDGEDGYLSSSSSEDENMEGAISWSYCFHEPFLEDIMTSRQAYREDNLREQTVHFMGKLDAKFEELLGEDDGMPDQERVKKAVEELCAEALRP